MFVGFDLDVLPFEAFGFFVFFDFGVFLPFLPGFVAAVEFFGDSTFEESFLPWEFPDVSGFVPFFGGSMFVWFLTDSLSLAVGADAVKSGASSESEISVPVEFVSA